MKEIEDQKIKIKMTAMWETKFKFTILEKNTSIFKQNEILKENLNNSKGNKSKDENRKHSNGEIKATKKPKSKPVAQKTKTNQIFQPNFNKETWACD